MYSTTVGNCSDTHFQDQGVGKAEEIDRATYLQRRTHRSIQSRAKTLSDCRAAQSHLWRCPPAKRQNGPRWWLDHRADQVRFRVAGRKGGGPNPGDQAASRPATVVDRRQPEARLVRAGTPLVRKAATVEGSEFW